MDKLVKHAPLLLLLGAALAFAAAFPAFVTAYLIQPVAISLWAAWRIAASVNQSVYWSLLILLFSLLAIRVFSSWNDGLPAVDHRNAPDSITRVERWRALFEDAARTQDGQVAVRESLRNLLISAITQAEHSPPANVNEALLAKRIPLPSAAYAYLFPDPGRHQGLSRGHLVRLLSHSPAWLRRLAGQAAQPDSAAINELLQWMETVVEMSHDK